MSAELVRTRKDAAAAGADPVTLQVVQSRLETLMRLMTRTLEQLAGTAVGREAGDYSTAFMDAEGDVIAFGSAVCTHLGHEVQIIPWIYEHYGRESIRPGDMFLSNDPYTGGSVHANDVGCVAPVFAEDELVGWVFCDMHFADVGGMVPGSFAPGAVDVVAEAIRFPPTRIYAAGEYCPEIVRAFINNTRVPTRIARDIASEVGALNVGIRAVEDLALRYGVKRLKTIMRSLMDFSEQMFRQRLRDLPDGVYECADYIEDGYRSDAIYRAFLRMTVAGDELYLDYRGSSEAAPALINCARSGLVGGIIGPLIQQLATGIPFNAGVLRPIHIRSEPGSFIDATYPSPVGLATGYGAAAVMETVFGATSVAFSGSGDPYLAARATAQWGAMHPCFIFSGASNQYGEYSLFLNMDGPGGQGQGGMLGIDGGRGNLSCLYGSVPSIEAHEVSEPFLYLSREIGVDSGGPGRWRGGFALRAAVIVWGEQSSPQSGTFVTGRNAVPTRGLFGGYPSSGVYYGPVPNTRVWERIEDGRMTTCSEVMAEWGEAFEPQRSKEVWEGRRFLAKGEGGEVFVMAHPGGGGYGDPLDREPPAVARDVADGVVSAEVAAGVYGVAITGDGGVDAER
ncbi:MAG TPA: hydantoinase B/oxoprolinase family protein, partial [Gaiellaceae bacterium]|nr:hydantoinase B/oxoprolinase family protein [Gaiellaceae bacterium]